jgi:hypothetical protein
MTLELNAAEIPLKMEHKPANPAVGNKQVRAGSEEKNRKLMPGHQPPQTDQFLHRHDLGIIIGRAADGQ